METRARRSIPVSLLSYASNQAVRLIATVVLARLLVPEDFGLLALCSLAISLLSIFNDLGLGSALVIRRELDARARGTALTIMLASSALLALGLVAVAPLAAGLFDEPRLEGLLRLISVSLFLSGPIWLYETLLQREFRFGRRFAAKGTQTVVYVAVSITLAVLGAEVWALIVGHVASFAAYLLGLLVVAPIRVRPAWDGAVARELLTGGRGFLFQDGTQYLEQNSDSFVIGGVLGATSLGLYGMAYRFSELIFTGIADPVAQVTFPGFARMRERGEPWVRAFVSALRLVMLVCCPLGVLLSGAADPLVRTLLGDKWLPTIGVLAVLGLWGALKPLAGTMGWALNSAGQAGRVAAVSAASLLLLVPGLVAAAELWGIVEVAWVMVAHVTLLTAGMSLLLARATGLRLRALASAVGTVLLAGAAAWAACRGTAEALEGLPAAAALVAALAAGGLAYVAALRLLDAPLLAQARSAGLSAMRRPEVAPEPGA
jgi:O-antigen/teichoic acid export membrane protein